MDYFVTGKAREGEKEDIGKSLIYFPALQLHSIGFFTKKREKYDFFCFI